MKLIIFYQIQHFFLLKLRVVMYQLSILVLLYNCGLEESKTLSSLFNVSFNLSNVKLVVWNNGPEKIKYKNISNGKNIEIEFIQTVHNESLSKIYNSFIDNNASVKYLILDHDSTVDQQYINSVMSSEIHNISIPEIICGGVIRAPFVNGKVYNKNMIFNNSDFIVSIGSGLVIGNDVIREMKNEYGRVFDERFFLYGVDTSFFKRLNKCLKKNAFEICVLPPINHSLSKLETEDEDISRFRIIERSYDMGLNLRYYTSTCKVPMHLMKYLFTDVMSCILNKKRYYSFLILIKAFFQGKHYRSKI